ncbi:MAG: cadherin-like beta sandwich domain-containing protein [Lachnospiraceae bacterium]|nr:cadherin-like beta sandwich domain-containing protein [Lachnospiraceae bacterium]
MKSKINKIMMGLVAGILMLFLFQVKAQAATATISVSSVSGTKGDTVTVNVSVTTDDLGMAEIWLSYDTNYLEYVSDGNDGVAGMAKKVLDNIPAGQAQVCSFNFRLKEAGTTTISVAGNTRVLNVNAPDPENADMNLNKTDGSVTINAASTASNDSHLSGLIVSAVTQNGDTSNVTYTPSFSPDVYEYKADLAANVTKLVVATTLSDANATTKVSGTRIDPGNNRTTITVTAQDGTESKYILYTVRATESTTETTTGTGDETTSETESTTGFDRTPKLIKEYGKYIIQDFSLTTIPEGFEESTAVYNGENIAVLRGISKPLTLMCLADDAQGTNIGIYIYNEASGAIDKMVNIISVQKMYTILPTDDTYAGPQGYTQTSLDINGDTVKAWVKSADSEFYVVYAMNWNGESALYVYDTKEQTMQRFVEGNKSETFDDEPEEEDTEYLMLKKKYDDMYEEYVNDHEKKNKTIGALCIAIIVILIGAALLLYYLRKAVPHQDAEGEDEEDLEEIGEGQEEKELKLDMVAQVNEVKAEKLAAQISEIMDDKKKEDKAADKTADKEDYSDEIGTEIEEQQAVKAEEVIQNETVNPVTANPTAENEKNDTTNKVEEPKSDKGEENLINMEDEEPFEIEFFDLDDNNKK